MMMAVCALSGCGSPQRTKEASSAPASGAPAGPLNKPAGVTQSIQIVAGVLPLGVVPYDNLALPLLSPDGRFAAVQTGAPPTWATMLAEPAAQVPVATRIEIYEFDLREGIQPKDRRQPALVAMLNEPAVLGRSADSEGFLVESPREDGARWIGKVTWTSGAVNWAVTGSDVNAFAALGPRGSLAWSRRAIEGMQFELVVRTGASPSASGDEWALPSPSAHWLMPVWSESSSRGLTLFALHLEGDHLEMRYFMAQSEAAARQSMQRLSLATECDIHTAYQTVPGQTPNAMQQSAALSGDQIVFFHPALRRIALWRPLALADRQRTQLNARSIAALVDQDDFAFVTVTTAGGHLVRQNLRNPSERMNLVAGLQIPRQTTAESWPYLLFNPGEGQIAVTAMKLLPREQSILGPSR